MFNLLLLVLIVVFIVWVAKRNPQNSINTSLVDTNSPEYIKGYLDGFRDHENNIENTQITQSIAGSASEDEFIEPVRVDKPEQARQVEKAHIQNINTALYMASFLLVIAAALFMQQDLTDGVKFAGVWFVTILFYASGLYVDKHYPKLKAAATAFIGTGLALLPFTGFALNFYILHDPAFCWMITSFIGLIGYIYAAVYLRSKTIAYFAIAFMVSLSTSSVASMNLALIWYFVALILLGSLLTFLAVYQPKYIPDYFAEPIEKTNSYIVPLTLLASLFAGSELALNEFSLISATCAIYYIAVALTASSNILKDYAILFARGLLSLSVLTLCYFATESYTSTGLMLSAVALVQLLISVMYMPIKKSGDINNESWLWFSFFLQLIAMIFIRSDQNWGHLLLMQLVILFVSSFMVALYLKRSEISLFGTFAAILIPLVWGKYVMNPTVGSEWLSLLFAGYLTVVLACRYFIDNTKKHPILNQVIVINFVAYLLFMMFLPLSAGNVWIFFVWLLASLAIYVYMIMQNNAYLLLAGNFTITVALFAILSESTDDTGWVLAISSIGFTSLYYLGNIVMDHYKKYKYAEYFWLTSIVCGLFFGVLGSYSSDIQNQSLAYIGVSLSSIIMMVRGFKHQEHALTSWGLIVLTFALQRLVTINVVDLNILIYTHWWALVFALLSYAYGMIGKLQNAKMFTIIGLSFITIFGGLEAISNMAVGSNIYSSLFLVEHALILIFGLITSATLQKNWGIVSLIVAVLWLMNGFTFLLPAIIAIMLIIFAIKSLSSQSSER